MLAGSEEASSRVGRLTPGHYTSGGRSSQIKTLREESALSAAELAKVHSTELPSASLRDATWRWRFSNSWPSISRSAANATPTTAKMRPALSVTGIATAAWALTALAPGFTAPERSSCKLQVCTGVPLSRANPAIPFPDGTQATTSCTGWGMFTAEPSRKPPFSWRWIVPATAPASRRKLDSQDCNAGSKLPMSRYTMTETAARRASVCGPGSRPVAF
jgi:hypothetical protein